MARREFTTASKPQSSTTMVAEPASHTTTIPGFSLTKCAKCGSEEVKSKFQTNAMDHAGQRITWFRVTCGDCGQNRPEKVVVAI